MKRNWMVMGAILMVAVVMIGAVACSSDNKKKTTTKPTATKSANATAVSTKAGETPRGGNAQSQVAVTLAEYQVKPVPTSVPSGSVKFEAKNIGGTEHELHVIKTDLAPDALPTKADGSVDEEAAGVTMVDHADNIAAGSEKSLTADLTPGKYVLVCNIVQTVNNQTVSHYAKGMHIAFTVTQ